MTSRLILSAGMPRAGSGWHYNLIHDLVVAAGGRDARQVRQRFFLQKILTEVNCNIGVLTFYRIIPALIPVFLGKTYVIKAHAGPKPLVSWLIQRKLVQPTYIYRDPRDALLSAYEYGQRTRAEGRTGAFSHLTSIDKAIEFMRDYVRISEAWLACGGVLNVGYEKLLTDYDTEANRLTQFLGLDIDQPGVRTVLENYRPAKGTSGQKGTHFVKGITGRYLHKLTSTQIARCNEAFGDYLNRLGYPIDPEIQLVDHE